MLLLGHFQNWNGFQIQVYRISIVSHMLQNTCHRYSCRSHIRTREKATMPVPVQSMWLRMPSLAFRAELAESTSGNGENTVAVLRCVSKGVAKIIKASGIRCKLDGDWRFSVGVRYFCLCVLHFR